MKEPENQHVNENKELEQEIEKLENRLQSEEKNKDTNIIHHLAFNEDHLAQVFRFLTHNLITTVVLILIAIIFSAIRWYVIVLIVLVTYAYPLLSNHSYYPWEKYLRRNHHSHKTKEKLKDKQETERSKKPSPNKDKIIVSALIIVIIILISLIIFFIASTKSTNSAHSHAQSTTVQRSSSEKKISSSNKKPVYTTQHTQQLSPANMDDKLKAAAAYYYASEHHQKMFEFKMAVQQNGLAIGKETGADYQEGTDPVSLMPLHTGSGAVPFYTTDNDNVYFYVPNAMPSEAIGEGNDDSDQPVLTTTWQEICDLVNQNGAYEQVKKVAENSEAMGD
ncbi:hypothetical protein PSQ53_02630 [Limosilactobacillus reuteri]|uniref:Uncharacterized protein n=1 Tax=Limosilactobacillus reuteri TaxID=1598 RepID=A0AAW6JDN2_LIMRT|nr:hypothetical protein [Limosilactobacillus reuteri]MDD1381867.1 hypothetical protein [Limosilactobacillus reuteri]MDD1398547.1 hypothetical protein [Limosilactobacillus reuteri]MDD1405297.1 hypothetical protein [Limosilactobacillus reuteri]